MSAGSQSGSTYKVGGSLDFNHSTYIRRKADQDLYNALKAGEYCYVLNARQTGKSSLRVQTKHKLQAEGFACGEVDLTGIISKQSTPLQVYAGIIQELTNSFQLKNDCISWWREREELSPIQRLSEFIDKILLTEIRQHIVIFVDEIDCFIGLRLATDDFFALIRFCYDRRTNNSQYQRLNFVLFGVATPSELIEDKNRTPFNIGRAIDINGFQFQEALPLVTGLSGKASNPQAVLKNILSWTGGQPFLTQKLCQLVLKSPEEVPADLEGQFIEQLVRSQIIESWESNDEPQHFRTIRDRLLSGKQPTEQLLKLYRQIWRRGEITADDSPQQMELRLSGLVVKQQGKLRVYNPLYAAVFDQHWIKEVLAEQRPMRIIDHIKWVALFLLSLVSFRSLLPKLHVQLNDLGVDNHLANRLAIAKIYYQCALLLKPDYRKAHYNLGSLYEKQQQLILARTEYKSAMQGNIGAAYNNLARLHILDKQYEEAVSLLVEGLQLEEAQTDPLVRYAFLKNLGWALLKQNRYPEAEPHLREAIQLMNTRAAAYGLLAQLLEAQGNKQEARVVWKNFLKYAPNDQSPEVEAWMIIAP